jgi:transposase-like protein
LAQSVWLTWHATDRPGRTPCQESPREFRRKVLGLLTAGRTVAQIANDLQISDQTIYVWRQQELIDTGQMPGLTSTDHADPVAAHKRTAELVVNALAMRHVPHRGMDPSNPAFS